MDHVTKLSVLCVAALLTACGGGGGSSSGSTSGGGTGNTAPVVNAGATQSVVQGDTVNLDSTASDSDGDTLTYTWTQTSGPNVTFSASNIADPTFEAPTVSGEEDVVLSLSVSDGTATRTDTVTITVLETAPAPLSDTWVINSTNERSKNIMDGAEFAEVDVLSAVRSGDFITITTNTIPGYEIEVTQELLDWYAGYYNGAYDTTTGDYVDASALGALGNIIDFGDDVGLTVTTGRCTSGGEGWWPNGGGACADAQSSTVNIPANPVDATAGCYTGVGATGYWVNGVPIFNWTDTFSVDDEGDWSYYAVPYRSRGMDICLGHGGGGFNNYHHHSYNECIRQEVGDEGTGHSPIYGYAGDGYPIHGPYHAAGELAQSCWFVRDYSADPDTGGGCADGKRSCHLVDEHDLSQGTTTDGVTQGPEFTQLVGVDYADVPAEAGFYREDFFYSASCTAQGDKYMDRYNGHEHDGLGYHYHTTVDDNMLPTYPLTPAPQLKGQAGGSFNCTTTPYDTGGGGMGGPP